MTANNQKFKMIIHKFRLTKTMAENLVSSRPPAQDTTDEPEELPYQERMLLAYKAYIDGHGHLAILGAA